MGMARGAWRCGLGMRTGHGARGMGGKGGNRDGKVGCKYHDLGPCEKQGEQWAERQKRLKEQKEVGYVCAHHITSEAETPAGLECNARRMGKGALQLSKCRCCAN